MTAQLPWDDLKVCFCISDNPDRLWRACDEGKAVFPEGWSLNETDISGAAGYVAIFRVKCLPTAADAYKVKAVLRRFTR
jgi:hypothetical protein